MPAPARAASVLLVALLASPLTRADVVRLSNGNVIRGEVLEETGERVVVRTLAGKITLPRGQVAAIERESPGERLLGEARQAARAGDRALELELLERARASGEEEVAREAEARLEALRGAAERGQGAEPGGRSRTWSGQGDPFSEPNEPEALIRELEAAARADPQLGPRLANELYRRGERRHAAGECRAAATDYRRAAPYAPEAWRDPLRQRELRCRLEVAQAAARRDPELVLLATAPIVEAEDDPLRPRALYLQGCALERLGREDEARAAFAAVLSEVKPPSELATLRELARLASVGLTVDADSPGIGAGWRWVRTPSLAVLHEVADLDPALPRRLEEARRAVIDRLALRGRLDEQGRIAVFLFRDRERYARSDGARSWSAGHAARLRAEGELIRAIYLYPDEDLEDRFRHEVAHILVGDALEDAVLPAWATEGVAIYAEGEASRARWLAAARAQQGAFLPVREAVGRMLPPLGEDAGEAQRFYFQSAVLFEVLAARVGVKRALEVALGRRPAAGGAHDRRPDDGGRAPPRRRRGAVA